ncbi:MAG: cytochrome c-type biogenesis protein CcmH [Acidimicrobiales bacterium]
MAPLRVSDVRIGTDADAARRSGVRRNAVWAVLGIALVCALAVGASGHGAPATPAQRAEALDAELRCPSCDDLSVADSSAASAVAIRQLVLADTEAGISDSSIVSYLQSRYPGIELRPPASGIEGLVWFAPLAGFALAICVIGAVFWRRQHVRTPPAPAEDDRRIVADALRAAQSRAQL